MTLVESSANVIREAFSKCLSERSGNASGVHVNGKPEGRRIGIYLTANLCLKLFFHCRKLRSAEQIFGNIYQQSPSLALFPASQRVTFLYYLGRYLFANSHFFRAQLALQAAYDQCHTQATKQRRLILIYLITSNIILGRFPSSQLLQRPEAKGFKEKFVPICHSIAKGDLAAFRKLLDLDSENAEWFLQRRILLQLQNRCEILVWRSLARKTFLLSGADRDGTSRQAPNLGLTDLVTLATYLEIQATHPPTTDPHHPKSRPPHTNSIFLIPDPSQPSPDLPYTSPDLFGAVPSTPPRLPTLQTIESTIASLIEQDLLHGFISHKLQRFAITGAKTKSALVAGFPNVWETISGKADSEVPGWVKEEKASGVGVGMMSKFGPGMVVNLSGARPAGAVPA